MSTLVAVDGVVYDLETSTESPDRVSALVGEAVRDDEEWGDTQLPSAGAPNDGPD